MVTKFFPASDVLLLHELGVRAIGENKDQEAGPKIAAVRTALRGNADLELHFVGRLQSNKARHVAGYADVVHSLDRIKLLRGLGGCGGAGPTAVGAHPGQPRRRHQSRRGAPS